MRTNHWWKVLPALLAAAVLFGTGVLVGANNYGKPNTLLHIVTIKWKPEATPEQKAAAIQGVEKMAAAIPGIKNIWLKTEKVQGQGFENVIAIEFESKAALEAYAKHEAHKAWYDIYIPIRAQSLTHDVTN